MQPSDIITQTYTSAPSRCLLPHVDLTKPQYAKNPPKHIRAITSRNAKESPLLRLPPETRNRIYHFALGGQNIHIRISRQGKDIEVTTCMTALDIDGRAESSERCVFVRGTRRSKYRNTPHVGSCCARDKSGLDLALLKPCRSVYYEAALMPCTSNTFVPADPKALSKFLSSLKIVQLRAIRRMSLDFVISAYQKLWRGQCEKLTGLRYLCLELRSQ